jgi:hypothetical protein
MHCWLIRVASLFLNMLVLCCRLNSQTTRVKRTVQKVKEALDPNWKFIVI